VPNDSVSRISEQHSPIAIPRNPFAATYHLTDPQRNQWEANGTLLRGW